MGSSGGGSSTTSGTTTIRYAPYIESKHETFLTNSAYFGDLAINNNPYLNFEDIEVDDGFFGAGFVLASFPGLYDVFGKFMAGLDIEVLWNELYTSTLESPAIADVITAQSVTLSDQLDTEVLPKFQTGMRDMNAVMSSTYVIGKALLVNQMAKELNKFAKEVRFKSLETAQDRWKAHLQWNMNVASNYANMVKTYFGIKQGMTELNFKVHAMKVLWPMTVLDFEKANLGALQGATASSSTSKTTQGDSGTNWLGLATSVIGLAMMFA